MTVSKNCLFKPPLPRRQHKLQLLLRCHSTHPSSPQGSEERNPTSRVAPPLPHRCSLSPCCSSLSSGCSSKCLCHLQLRNGNTSTRNKFSAWHLSGGVAACATEGLGFESRGDFVLFSPLAFKKGEIAFRRSINRICKQEQHACLTKG